MHVRSYSTLSIFLSLLTEEKYLATEDLPV